MLSKKNCLTISCIALCICATPNLSYSQNLITPDYLGSVQQKVSLNFVYPKEASLKGWEGVVKVRFILTPDGQVKNIDIAQSSGNPLLDESAIAAVKNASPYPFPSNYSGDIEITLPIAYQKTESSKTPAPPPQPQSAKPAQAKQSNQADTAAQTKPPSQGQDRADQKQPTAKAPAKKPAAATEKPAQPYQVSTPATVNQQVAAEEPTPLDKELNYFIEFALQNNQPTQVAREEIELAQMKITEAKRSFFPGAKLTAYTTSGDVYKVDYEEREIKAEINQPLYYGGRLGDTYNQAKVNLEITKRNYDRLKLDVIQKTETAYYNLLAAQKHAAIKQALLDEAADLLKKVETLASIGMVIPLEITSARSWYKQMELQMDALRQDLFMAELTFKQIINSNDPITINTELPEFKPVALDLLTCQQAAIRSRPEIYLSRLLVKFSEYGQKIESNKNNSFTVDLTSSYGRYSGHYITEPWRDATNWFMGIKASKPWGASTLNGNYSSDTQQPRFGQTSATTSQTYSGELLFFDNYRRLAEKKRSDVDLHRSISDFNEAIKTISFEVRDALLNYQKAAFELEGAQVDMQYRRSDMEITKIRSMVGDAGLSSAVESLFRLSDAQSRYIRALANCQIALATLKKACGYGLKL